MVWNNKLITNRKTHVQDIYNLTWTTPGLWNIAMENHYVYCNRQIHGPFSVAMLNYRRATCFISAGFVTLLKGHPFKNMWDLYGFVWNLGAPKCDGTVDHVNLSHAKSIGYIISMSMFILINPIRVLCPIFRHTYCPLLLHNAIYPIISHYIPLYIHSR